MELDHSEYEVTMAAPDEYEAAREASRAEQAAWEATRIPLYQAGKDGAWPRDLAAHYEGSGNADPTAGLIHGYKQDFTPSERRVLADFRSRNDL